MRATPENGLNARVKDLAADKFIDNDLANDKLGTMSLFHPDSLLPIDPMLHPDNLEEFHPIYDKEYVLLTKSGRSKLHKDRLTQLQHIWQSLDTIGLTQPLRKSSNMKATLDNPPCVNDEKELDIAKFVFGRQSRKKTASGTHAASTEENGLDLAKLVFG